MNAHIVVEGNIDKEILSKLLSDLSTKHTFSIAVGQSRDAARPIARKYLVAFGEPVALVFDTDTTDQDQVREQVQDLNDYFKWQSMRAPYELIPMVPMMEVVFFDQPKPLERHLGGRLDPNLKIAGHHAPKEILTNLLPKLHCTSLSQFIEHLSPGDIQELRKHPTIKKLRKFIEANL